MTHAEGDRTPIPAILQGMDTTTDVAAARLDRFLDEEPVIWLSTVRPDGTPHLVPTWFAWDGEVITIMSKPGAQKVRNLRAHRRAMLALGDAEDDFDVGLVEADAELVDGPVRPAPGFVAKYGERMDALGLTPESFAATYSQVIRLTPIRALGWHGRTQPKSVVAASRRIAARRSARAAERPAGRPSVREWLADQLVRGRRSLRPTMRQAGVAI